MHPRAFCGLIPRFLFAALGAALVFSQARANDPSSVQKALDEARSLAEAGDYPAALAKHILFHRHILESDPAMAGVRLSFALSDWKRLGAKYPPALAALRAIRDEDATLLLTDKRTQQLFQDVAAINGELGLNEPKATVELFKKLDAQAPTFATQAYRSAEEVLVASGELALARKHLGDPGRRFAENRRFFESLKEFEGNRGGAAEKIFTERTMNLIRVLEGAGDHTGALAIQAKALTVVTNDELRAAVKK